MRFLFALLLAGALLWACGGRPSELRDVRGDIRLADDQLMAALAARDPDRLAGFYAADAQLLPPNDTAVVGRARIRNFWAAAMDGGITRMDLMIDETAGTDRMAIEVGRYVVFDGNDGVLDEGKYMVWWKRTGDGWRLYRDIFNSNLPIP